MADPIPKRDDAADRVLGIEVTSLWERMEEIARSERVKSPCYDTTLGRIGCLRDSLARVEPSYATGCFSHRRSFNEKDL